MRNTTASLAIRGTGHFLPGIPVYSNTLDEKFGFECGHLERETGVNSRYYAGELDQIEMAVLASQQALEQAELDAKDIDLVVSASGIPYQTLPSTAPLIMRNLGIADGKAAALDVNSSCSSFISAMDLIWPQVACGAYSNALIVSSEIASRGLPWSAQPEVAALFGDGAAAAIISTNGRNAESISASLMRSYPSCYAACEIRSGGTRIKFHEDPEEFARHTIFHMNGNELFKITLKHFPAFVDELLAKAGWRKKDVDVVVPHQASPHALEYMVRQTGFSSDQIVNLASDIGNQIAASVPTALDWARRDGRAKSGTKMLILGTSAGVSFAGLAMQL